MVSTEREISNSAESEEQTLSGVFSGIPLSLRENIAVQTLDTYDLTLEEKRSIFNLFVWHETGSISSLKRFGEIREDQDAIIGETLDDDEFVDLYDEFYDEYLSRLPRRKEDVLKIASQTNSVEEIAKEAEVDIFDVQKIITDRERETSQSEARRKVLNRKDWREIKLLREQGLSNLQISEAMHIPLQRVRNITSTLIFINVIEPSKRGKARAEASKKLAVDVSDLIETGLWDFREISEKLKSNTKSIRRAVLMMIDTGRKDLIQIYDDNDRYTRKYRDKLKLIEDLWNFKKKNSLEIAEEIDMPVEWVRNRIKYLRGKNRVERRHTFVDKKKLKKDMLIFLRGFVLERPGKYVSARIIINGVGRGGEGLVRDIHAELATKHEIPPLNPRPKKYEREKIEEMIMLVVQGLDLDKPINLAKIYKDTNPACGKGTFYNIYRAMAKRMTLPPLVHGGRVRGN